MNFILNVILRTIKLHSATLASGMDYMLHIRVTVSVCVDEVKRNIMAAMRHWETQTCIRFVNRTTHSDFIVFNSGRCG